MFKGFNLAYPEYEVITPQTKASFKVRSLNVQEEERLKGSLMTPTKVTEHLNQCIYDSITSKPENITDYNSFLKNVTIKDREALLYGLYHITYEDIRNYDVLCGSCSKRYPITVKASSTFNFNEYPENDVLTKKIKCDLPMSKGVSAIIKQPTLFDEITSLKNSGVSTKTNLDISTETSIIEQFEQDVEESKNPIIYNEREDIIDAYLSLPAKDKREIFNKYQENFGKYGIELKMLSHCQFCGHEEVINIDLVDNFFRMVYSA